MGALENADQNITIDVVEKSLKNQKAGKAAGLVASVTDSLTLGGKTCEKWLVRRFNISLNARRIPMD